MLNNVTFIVGNGGLGRQAAGDDHISALLFASTPAPTALNGLKGKAYAAIGQVIQDGIIEGDAIYGLAYYHASEFFRLASGATLYLFFGATTNDIFTIGEGKIKQLATTVIDVADVQSVYQNMVNDLTTLNAPLQIVLGWDAAFDAATAANLETKQSENVSVLIAGDGAAKGAALALSLGKPYIPCIGAVLGLLARAKVHESIAWVKVFNISDGKELNVIRLADGTNKPSEAVLSLLNDKRYLLLRKHIGIGGTYMNDSHTATVVTSDYAYLENGRTIHKMRRGIRSILLPELNAPVYVDPDTGKLSPDSIAYFENLASQTLENMERLRELSGSSVYIDPNQNVLATSKLIIQARGVPVGVARNIEINLGFAVTTNF